MEMTKTNAAKARMWEVFQAGQRLMAKTGKDLPLVVHMGTLEGEEIIFPSIADPEVLAGVIGALAREKHAEYVILVCLGWIVRPQNKPGDVAAWYEWMQREREGRGGSFENVPGRIEVIQVQMRSIGSPVTVVMAELRRDGNAISFGEAREMKYLEGGPLRPWEGG